MAGEINKRIQKLNTELSSKKLAEEAYRFFYAITPYASGNAKRNTRLLGDTIQAAYPYAGRLDTGYSPQAPKGMSIPTDEHVRKYIKKVNKG